MVEFSSPLTRWLDRRARRLPPREPRDWRAERRFWFSRDTYNRRSIPILLQLLIWLAVGGLCFAHALAWRASHDALSGATALVMLAIIFYPFVRHRIERGRWPD